LACWHLLILSTVLAWQTPASSTADGDSKTSPAPSTTTAAKSATAPEPDSKKAKRDAAESPAAKKGEAPPKPAARKATTGPRVLTRAEMQKARSEFLEPPGTEGAAPDRYGPGTPDWREIPPWRQTSFFGIRAPGRFFVYVIDCSESMIEDDRLARATIEVRRSVLALQAPQQFEVIFYNHESIPMPGGPQPRAADTQNKGQLLSWLRLIEPDGGTNPRTAIKQALMLRPDAVFLLSDGAFPDGTASSVAKFNAHKIPIHCVDLSGGEGGEHLRKIAKDSGGQYASRPGNLQGKR
jgi:hypothetical protein